MAHPSNQAPGQPGSHAPQAYLKTKVLTASPAELRLMLLDGAIRFSEQARRGYESKDFESAFDGTTKAQAILLELINALRPDQAPELCKRLSALYTFMYTSLVQASTTRDVALVDEVIQLLRFEAQFAAMEAALAKLQGQQSSLGAIAANMAIGLR